MKNDLVLYVHGKGGSAAESEHYAPLFTGCDVLGLDYKSATPWSAKEEFYPLFKALKAEYKNITLISNSIGAYFCMNAGIEEFIQQAFFISPIVDMEKLICDMMRPANVTE